MSTLTALRSPAMRACLLVTNLAFPKYIWPGESGFLQASHRTLWKVCQRLWGGSESLLKHKKDLVRFVYWKQAREKELPFH